MCNAAVPETVIEQRQVPEAVEWLQRDLAIAKERVVRTSNQ